MDANDSSNSLEPAEHKILQFYEDELVAVRMQDGEILVPVRRLCDNLGLSWSGQRERINRDEVLQDALRSVRITRTDLESKFAPGQSDMLCLPLKLIPGWLFGINASRAREEIREKLTRYRRECFDVLWNAFKTDILPVTDPALEPRDAELTSAERALALAEAVYTMARQQVAMERWLAAHDMRMDAMEDHLDAVDSRLDRAAEVVKSLQLRIYGPYQVISEEQAAELAELVKTIAHTLTEDDPQGKNYYQSVWGELHRRYGVTSYRRVPAVKFGEVIQWLESWLHSLLPGAQTNQAS